MRLLSTDEMARIAVPASTMVRDCPNPNGCHGQLVPMLDEIHFDDYTGTASVYVKCPVCRLSTGHPWDVSDDEFHQLIPDPSYCDCEKCDVTRYTMVFEGDTWGYRDLDGLLRGLVEESGDRPWKPGECTVTDLTGEEPVTVDAVTFIQHHKGRVTEYLDTTEGPGTEAPVALASLAEDQAAGIRVPIADATSDCTNPEGCDGQLVPVCNDVAFDAATGMAQVGTICPVCQHTDTHTWALDDDEYTRLTSNDDALVLGSA